jgi:hypothetical protein
VAGTDFGTPWAEKTTGRSSGTSSSSSTKCLALRARHVRFQKICWLQKEQAWSQPREDETIARFVSGMG